MGVQVRDTGEKSENFGPFLERIDFFLMEFLTSLKIRTKVTIGAQNPTPGF